MSEDKSVMVARNLTIYPEQEEMLVHFAKEHGQTVSGALRYILNEWAHLKGVQLAEQSAETQA